MNCSQCGQNLPEGSRFCESCGAPVGEALEIRPPAHETIPRQASPGVVAGGDGVLRWAYEMDMWKNPTLVITLWKVLLLAAFAPALLVFFLNLGGGFEAAALAFVKVLAIVLAIVSGLMLLAYPLVALMNGGRYCVVFEMDENGVKHTQVQKQFNKAQVLGMITGLAGVMAGNFQTAGAGMLAASKQSSLSRFERVKTIVVHEKRRVLYVNESLSRNQVYADPADFPFVKEYILSRCKHARVTYR